MHRTVLTTYDLSVDRPELSGRSFTCAFLSDMHGCCRPSEQAVIRSLMAELGPDLILCGGDMIVSRIRFDARPVIKFLGSLKDIAPVFMANGNHESKWAADPDQFGTSYTNLIQALADRGVRHLENERFRTDVNGVPVEILGLDIPRSYFGYWTEPEIPECLLDETFGETDPHAFSLLLAHHPGILPAAMHWGADLTLCGHIHGGIVRFGEHTGLIGPDLRLFIGNAYGLFQKDGKHGMITSGCGEHTLPFRLHNPREIVGIRIRFS